MSSTYQVMSRRQRHDQQWETDDGSTTTLNNYNLHRHARCRIRSGFYTFITDRNDADKTQVDSLHFHSLKNIMRFLYIIS